MASLAYTRWEIQRGKRPSIGNIWNWNSNSGRNVRRNRQFSTTGRYLRDKGIIEKKQRKVWDLEVIITANWWSHGCAWLSVNEGNRSVIRSVLCLGRKENQRSVPLCRRSPCTGRGSQATDGVMYPAVGASAVWCCLPPYNPSTFHRSDWAWTTEFLRGCTLRMTRNWLEVLGLQENSFMSFSKSTGILDVDLSEMSPRRDI